MRRACQLTCTRDSDAGHREYRPCDAVVSRPCDSGYGHGVASSDGVSHWQLQELARVLGRQGRYLSEVCQPIQKLGWKSDDLLYARTVRARDGVLSLISGLDEMQRERDKPAWMRSRGA